VAQPLAEFKYECRLTIETIDDIWDRAERSFYHNLNDLVTDLELVVKRTIAGRCLNQSAKIYCTSLLAKAVAFIKTKKAEFKTKWRSYFDSKFQVIEQNYPKVTGNWYKAPGPKRDYNILQSYKISTPQG
jgi:hypothetical protein